MQSGRLSFPTTPGTSCWPDNGCHKWAGIGTAHSVGPVCDRRGAGCLHLVADSVHSLYPLLFLLVFIFTDVCLTFTMPSFPFPSCSTPPLPSPPFPSPSLPSPPPPPPSPPTVDQCLLHSWDGLGHKGEAHLCGRERTGLHLRHPWGVCVTEQHPS